MQALCEVLVLGIGNVLWADEGFGVRAVEALHAQFRFPAAVTLRDGGTLGLNLYDDIATAHSVLVFDAIDFALAPGTLRVLRDAEVPAWGRAKLSPHQNGFNDVLALAQLNGRAPQRLTAIGVQPLDISDFGGSLTEIVRSSLDEAVARGARQLAAWGYAGMRWSEGTVPEPLNASPLALAAYESGRPSEVVACRTGDERVLRTAAVARKD